MIRRIFAYFPKRIFLFGIALFVLVTALIILSNVYSIKKEIIIEVQKHAEIVAKHLSYELFDVYGFKMDELESVSDEEFNAHFLSQIRPLGVESVKIYNDEGVIVLSNTPELVGKKTPKNENFKKALNNLVTSNIASAEYYRKVYNVPMEKDLVETYIPVFDKNTNIVGVFEIYQDYAPLGAEIASAVQRTVLIITSLMLCFSIVLFALVRRGNIIIASEKERLVKELEDTVERRTKELRESENKYRTFLDNVTDAVAVIDNKGKFVLANNKVLEITGCSLDEIYEGRFNDILEGTKSNLKVADNNLKAALAGKDVSFELNVKRKNGGCVPLEFAAKNIIFDGEKVIMAAGRDITDRKEMEGVRNDFYSMLTHDFRVPLTPILGFAEILLEERWDSLNEKSRDMIGTISRNAERLNKLIDDFLLSSKLDSDSLVLLEHKYELHPFIDEVVNNFRANIEAKDLRLFKKYSSENFTLKGDIPQMERVLSNLLTNAIKYNAEQGILKVKTSKVDNFRKGFGIKVEVFNSHGIISEKDIPHVFEKYTRTERTRKVSGTGLGLYIAKSIINLHGGEISVFSKEGIGTTFSFILPLTDIPKV